MGWLYIFMHVILKAPLATGIGNELKLLNVMIFFGWIVHNPHELHLSLTNTNEQTKKN